MTWGTWSVDDKSVIVLNGSGLERAGGLRDVDRRSGISTSALPTRWAVSEDTRRLEIELEEIRLPSSPTGLAAAWRPAGQLGP